VRPAHQICWVLAAIVAGRILVPVGLGDAFLGVDDINLLPSAPADARIAYGPEPDQFGELRLPKGKGFHPVAVVIHGGCWVESYANLQNTAALADALRRQGMATWNIEYRRSDMRGGGWPGTFLDVARAIDFLRVLAGKYPLDLTRVISIGHSAGGQLALWAAARHRLPTGSAVFLRDPLTIAGVLALGTPCDLAGFRRKETEVCGQPVVTRLLGGSPGQVSERYAQASPIEMLPLGVPQIIITASADFVESPAEGAAYAAAARRAGDSAHQRVIQDAGHFEYLSPSSAAWPVVRAAARELAGLPRSMP